MGFKHAVLLCLFSTLVLSLLGCQDDEWRTVATITPKPQPCESPSASTPDGADAAAGSLSAPAPDEEPPADALTSPEIQEDPELTKAPIQQDKTDAKGPSRSGKPTENPKKNNLQNPPSAPPPPTSPAGCVDINAAPLDALMTLPGVGQSRAQQIVQRRPFTKLRDLSKVKGIGPKTLERLTPLLCPIGK